jgi:hypothetical protein
MALSTDPVGSREPPAAAPPEEGGRGSVLSSPDRPRPGTSRVPWSAPCPPSAPSRRPSTASCPCCSTSASAARAGRPAAPVTTTAPPSLSIAVGREGRVLLKCHAGCGLADILTPLGLQPGDLFADDPDRVEPRVAATYNYKDEDGRLLFQVVRYQPKAFRQRVPDGNGGWVWRLGSTRRVLYNLHDVARFPTLTPVLVVEGEKDCDNLMRIGVLAVTNPGGAGKWRPEYNASLAGRQVVVVPDNDEPGREHARQVVRNLLPVAEWVRVLELPGLPPKGDLSDWLKAGGDVNALWRLAGDCPEGAAWLAAPPATERDPGDLSTTLADVAARPVRWLWPGRLALGKLAILDGDPGLGKSLVTLDLCARVTTGREFPDGRPGCRGAVVLVNCEDGVADTLRPRLDALGADPARVHVLRGRVEGGVERLPSFPRDLARLERVIRRTGAVLVVIDPIMAFLDETISTGNDQSVRQALAPLARLAEETGCVILLVRHLNKTGGARAVYRGGGSVGIVGACRSGWLIARDPGEPRRRVLAQVKNNLGPAQKGLLYEVVGDESGRPQVAWLGEVDLAADQLVGGGPAADGEAPISRAEVVERLREMLADGPRPVDEVLAQLMAEGVSRRTVFRARREAGVVTVRERTQAGTVFLWRLGEPGEREPDDPPAADLFGGRGRGPYPEGSAYAERY